MAERTLFWYYFQCCRWAYFKIIHWTNARQAMITFEWFNDYANFFFDDFWWLLDWLLGEVENLKWDLNGFGTISIYLSGCFKCSELWIELKVSFFSESAIHFSNLQTNYSKSEITTILSLKFDFVAYCCRWEFQTSS